MTIGGDNVSLGTVRGARVAAGAGAAVVDGDVTVGVPVEMIERIIREVEGLRRDSHLLADKVGELQGSIAINNQSNFEAILALREYTYGLSDRVGTLAQQIQSQALNRLVVLMTALNGIGTLALLSLVVWKLWSLL